MTVMINAKDSGLLPNSSRSVTSLGFQQTVPRYLVHRAAVSEVFVTDVHVLDGSMFQVGAQWPRAHSFFGPKAGSHDPLLFAETLRQATLVVAHQVFEVPQDAVFILQDHSYDITERGLRLGAGPTNVMLTGRARDVRRQGGSISRMRLEFGCYRDMERVGGGSIRWSCASPKLYARLRARATGTRAGTPTTQVVPTPVAPGLVGRHLDSDVVLCASPLENTWLLRVDTEHPVLFDHEVDHVPGVVLTEAARQAARLATGRPDAVPVCGRFSFARYLELDQPCVVTASTRPADSGQGTTVQVTFEQAGDIAATAAVDLLVRG